MDRRSLLAGGGLALAAGGGAAWISARRMGSMTNYEAAVAETRSALSLHPEPAELVRYASLAPSGHNTQPWRFRLSHRRIDILPDPAKRTPVVDPDDHHLFVSLGGAAETLALAATARGLPGEAAFDPESDGAVRFSYADGPASGSALFDAIPRRQSTRADYDGRAVSAADLGMLEAAARMPGVDFILITDRPRINRVRDLIIEGNSAQLADPAFVRELKSWIRFSPRQAIETGDGLFSVSGGTPPLPDWLGSAMFDATFKPTAENDRYARQIDTSAGLAVFVGKREDREHWTRVGRSSQRFALQATALGLKVAYVNQPVELPALRPQLAALVGLPDRRPDLAMRFGHGPTMAYSARRRPVLALSEAT